MKHQDLLNEFKSLISQLRKEVEAASAMQHYDIHKIAEHVICSLFRDLCGYEDMRNLNVDQSNFPGIDLADNNARLAVQVTATADLAKVKSSLEKFLNHGLQKSYDRLIIYILTTKQNSYSQSAIDSVISDAIVFQAKSDIWDYEEICYKAANASPAKLKAAVDTLTAYIRGVPLGLADEDMDPPQQPSESLISNLLRIYFPHDLFIAQLNSDIVKSGRKRDLRKAIRAFNQEMGISIPSAYVAYNGNLVTFFDLEDPYSPYRHLFERGTEERLTSEEFYDIDQGHENAFKSLLRFSLQQRIFAERVLWYNDEKKFVFLPIEDHLDQREEVWQGKKKAKRVVYHRQYNKKDSSKIFKQKHLAFSVDFHHFSEDWLMSITPSWLFSYGENFAADWRYGHENLSWIKRQENNRAVLNHLRFLVTWLKNIDKEDLFSTLSKRDAFLSFDELNTYCGAPALDESIWAPLSSENEESEDSDTPLLELLET